MTLGVSSAVMVVADIVLALKPPTKLVAPLTVPPVKEFPADKPTCFATTINDESR